jgi:hypothetical protein
MMQKKSFEGTAGSSPSFFSFLILKSLINRIIKVIPCEYTLSIRGRMGKGTSDAVTVPKPP